MAVGTRLDRVRVGLTLYALAIACNSMRLSVSVPSSFLAAMAPSTSAKLALITPVIPMALKSSAVRAGLGVPPAAVSCRALAMRANSSILATVLTSATCAAPMMSLSRARFSVSVAASPMLAPILA